MATRLRPGLCPGIRRVDAGLVFDGNGPIRRHHDRFDVRRWSRQALGLPGQPAVRSAFLRDEVRAQASAKPQRHAARRRA
jgi:hypothetical protein